MAFQEDFDLAQKIDEIDKTFPKHDGMHKAAGEFMAEWNNAIEDDERSTGTLTAKGTAGKRYFDDVSAFLTTASIAQGTGLTGSEAAGTRVRSGRRGGRVHPWNYG